MGIDKILLCNMALPELPCDAIESFEENSTAAEWCGRLYAPTLAYCLDRHDWKFPRARQSMAVVDNDRPAEWAFAYAMPAECVTELRVLPVDDGSWSSVPILGGLGLAPWLLDFLTVPTAYRFLVSGSTIYTNIENAVLEFIIGNPSESGFRPMFTDGFRLTLASRLVMPVKQDRTRQGDLLKMAAIAMDLAIADEMNRDESGSTYGQFMNETELARQGGAYFGYWPAGALG